MDITLLAAFMAGVASLLSPCVVPLLPTYFAFLGGNSEEGAQGRPKLLINSLCFFAGFTLVFVLMGASASLLGQLFFDYQEEIKKIGAVILLLMGLQLLGVFNIAVLQQEHRPLLGYAVRGPLGSFVFGAAVTAGWTPCIGPILAAILMYAGTADTASRGALLLLMYALGFCLPFVLLALLYNKVIFRFTFLYAWLPWIQRISGAMIVLAAAAVYFDWMNWLLAQLTMYWQ